MVPCGIFIAEAKRRRNIDLSRDVILTACLIR